MFHPFPEDGALVVETANTPQVLQAVPEAFEVIPGFHGMAFDLDTCIRLAARGMRPPSPIEHYYRWPRDLQKVPQPYAHQVDTAGFLTINPRAFCLNDIGSGKTISTAWAADYLMEIGAVQRALIIAPLSTLERAWGDTLFFNFRHRTYNVLHGSAAKRRKLLAQQRDFYIINHDGIGVIKKELEARDDINLIIIDEVAHYRNSRTEKWRAINSVIYPKNKPPRPWVWGLTGGPTPNAPTDAYGQCRLVTPTSVPQYFSQFRNMVMEHQSTYVWTPRAEANKIVYSAMRPAIRYRRDECLDLPGEIYSTYDVEMSDEQQRHYKNIMRELYTEVAEGAKVTAVNEGVKLSKLVQIACIAEGTPVLTDAGWLPIERVTLSNLVWDGVEWVSHGGAIYKGLRETVVCGGVQVTPEHEMLTIGGWQPAKDILNGKSGEEFGWAEVRLPDCVVQSGDHERIESMRDVAVPLRVRERRRAEEPISSLQASQAPPELWMPSRERNSQDERISPISYMDSDAAPLPRQERPRLAELWRSWHTCMRQVGSFLRRLLGRHASWVCRTSDSGADQQRWHVLPSQLPVGDSAPASKQQTEQPLRVVPGAETDPGTSSASDRDAAWDAARSGSPVWVALGKGSPRTAAAHVYDIVNCGPRSRFVVRGAEGEMRIVHNCGVVYDTEGKPNEIDPGNRVETLLEMIEMCNEKVIVFVPFTEVTNMLYRHVSKHWSAAVVYGEVNKNERDQIFADFQSKPDPSVLIAHPGCMAHGLTLTEASTIIWYAPVDSNDTYTQANGRITRPGQTQVANIVHLAGSAVERKAYKRLEHRQKLQGVLLEMVENNEQ